MNLVWPDFTHKASPSKKVEDFDQQSGLNKPKENESISSHEDNLVPEAVVKPDSVYNKLYRSNIKKLKDLYK